MDRNDLICRKHMLRDECDQSKALLEKVKAASENGSTTLSAGRCLVAVLSGVTAKLDLVDDELKDLVDSLAECYDYLTSHPTLHNDPLYTETLVGQIIRKTAKKIDPKVTGKLAVPLIRSLKNLVKDLPSDSILLTRCRKLAQCNYAILWNESLGFEEGSTRTAKFSLRCHSLEFLWLTDKDKEFILSRHYLSIDVIERYLTTQLSKKDVEGTKRFLQQVYKWTCVALGLPSKEDDSSFKELNLESLDQLQFVMKSFKLLVKHDYLLCQQLITEVKGHMMKVDIDKRKMLKARQSDSVTQLILEVMEVTATVQGLVQPTKLMTSSLQSVVPILVSINSDLATMFMTLCDNKCHYVAGFLAVLTTVCECCTRALNLLSIALVNKSSHKSGWCYNPLFLGAHNLGRYTLKIINQQQQILGNCIDDKQRELKFILCRDIVSTISSILQCTSQEQGGKTLVKQWLELAVDDVKIWIEEYHARNSYTNTLPTDCYKLIVSPLSNMALVCYRAGMYEEAAFCFERSCTLHMTSDILNIQKTATDHKLWSKFMHCSESLRMCYQYQQALDTVIKGLLCDQNHMTSTDHSHLTNAAEIWARIKADCYSKLQSPSDQPQLDGILKRKMSVDYANARDSMVASGLLSTQRHQLMAQELLEYEFTAMRNRSTPIQAALLYLAEDLSALCKDEGGATKKCFYLCYKAQLQWLKRSEDKSVLVEVLQNIVRQLNVKPQFGTSVERSPSTLDVLAQTYTWLYIVRDVDPSQFQYQNKLPVAVDPGDPTLPRPQNEGTAEDYESDLEMCMSLAAEPRVLRPLLRALSLWEQCVTSKKVQSQILHPDVTADLLITVASIFKLLQKHSEQCKALSLAVRVAMMNKNTKTMLEAHTQLMSLFVGLKHPQFAADIARNMELYITQQEQQKDAKLIKIKCTPVYFQYLVATAELNLHLGKVDVCRSMLENVQNLINKHLHPMVRETSLLKIAINLIQVRVYNQIEVPEPSGESVHESMLECVYQNVRYVNGVVRLMLGEWNKGHAENDDATNTVPDNTVERWELVGLMLSLLLESGRLYLRCGANMEVFLFLFQALQLAQYFNVARRFVEGQLLLAQRSILMHDFSTCSHRLNIAKFILKSASGAVNLASVRSRLNFNNDPNPKQRKKSAKDSSKPDQGEEKCALEKHGGSVSVGNFDVFVDAEISDDDCFDVDPELVVQGKDLNEKTDIEPDGEEELSSSPRMKQHVEWATPPHWHHTVSCTCQHCTDFTTQRLNVGECMLEAERRAHTEEPATSNQVLDSLMSHLNNLNCQGLVQVAAMMQQVSKAYSDISQSHDITDQQEENLLLYHDSHLETCRQKCSLAARDQLCEEFDIWRVKALASAGTEIDKDERLLEGHWMFECEVPIAYMLSMQGALALPEESDLPDWDEETADKAQSMAISLVDDISLCQTPTHGILKPARKSSDSDFADDASCSPNLFLPRAPKKRGVVFAKINEEGAEEDAKNSLDSLGLDGLSMVKVMSMLPKIQRLKKSGAEKFIEPASVRRPARPASALTRTPRVKKGSSLISTAITDQAQIEKSKDLFKFGEESPRPNSTSETPKQKATNFHKGKKAGSKTLECTADENKGEMAPVSIQISLVGAVTPKPEKRSKAEEKLALKKATLSVSSRKYVRKQNLFDSDSDAEESTLPKGRGRKVDSKKTIQKKCGQAHKVKDKSIYQTGFLSPIADNFTSQEKSITTPCKARLFCHEIISKESVNIKQKVNCSLYDIADPGSKADVKKATLSAGSRKYVQKVTTNPHKGIKAGSKRLECTADESKGEMAPVSIQISLVGAVTPKPEKRSKAEEKLALKKATLSVSSRKYVRKQTLFDSDSDAEKPTLPKGRGTKVGSKKSNKSKITQGHEQRDNSITPLADKNSYISQEKKITPCKARLFCNEIIDKENVVVRKSPVAALTEKMKKTTISRPKRKTATAKSSAQKARVMCDSTELEVNRTGAEDCRSSSLSSPVMVHQQQDSAAVTADKKVCGGRRTVAHNTRLTRQTQMEHCRREDTFFEVPVLDMVQVTDKSFAPQSPLSICIEPDLPCLDNEAYVVGPFIDMESIPSPPLTWRNYCKVDTQTSNMVSLDTAQSCSYDDVEIRRGASDDEWVPQPSKLRQKASTRKKAILRKSTKPLNSSSGGQENTSTCTNNSVIEGLLHDFSAINMDSPDANVSVETSREACVATVNKTPPKELSLNLTEKETCAIHLQSCTIPAQVCDPLSPLLRAFHSLRHNPPLLPYRHICQILGILYYESNDPWQSAFYFLEAQAITLRHRAQLNISRKIRHQQRDDTTSNETYCQSLRQRKHTINFGKDIHWLKNTLLTLPSEWEAVHLCVVEVPSRATCAMYAVRLSAAHPPCVVRLRGFKKPPLSEFSSIIECSKQAMSLKDRSLWWETRTKLDTDLMDLMKKIGSNWFGPALGLLMGTIADSNSEHLHQVALTVVEQLKALGLGHVNVQLVQALLQSVQNTSDRDLCNLLYDFAIERGPKAVTAVRESTRVLKEAAKDLNCGDWQRHPLILLLDRSVQHLPLECLCLEQRQTYTRLPSIHFLAVQLEERCSAMDSDPECIYSRGVDLKNTYYLLNPGGDLQLTQERFQDWFAREQGWTGCVGSTPSEDKLVEELASHDLYLYVGHGGGYRYLKPESIEMMRCRAVTVLAGCSSGILDVTGELDPQGNVLSFLLAGSPCVVSSLWDITDRDMDRYLTTVIQTWQAAPAGSCFMDYLAAGVEACKFNGLIGYAIITYGLPVSSKS